MTIREPDMSKGVDFTRATDCWQVRGATLPQLVRHLGYTLSIIGQEEGGVEVDYEGIGWLACR